MELDYKKMWEELKERLEQTEKMYMFISSRSSCYVDKAKAISLAMAYMKTLEGNVKTI